MRGWLKGLLALVALSTLPNNKHQAVAFGGDDFSEDSFFTLILFQMITQRENNGAMQSLYPLLLSSIMGNEDNEQSGLFKYILLLGAGNDPNMQQWLPLILNNGDKSTSDKLLMLIFMQQNQVMGDTGMSNMFPLMLMNSQLSQKTCEIGSKTCTCDAEKQDLLMYIMLLNGNSFGNGESNYNNFMFMMFDDDSCDGTYNDNSRCSCDKPDGGIDAMTYLMLMKMNPVITTQIQETPPPQRAIDIKSVIKNQIFAQLGPQYSWMRDMDNIDGKEMARFQLYQQMGIPPSMMGIMDKGKEQSADDRFALIQWMAQGKELSIEIMSLMVGIEDAKEFYIHSMIEKGNVNPMTASLLLASQSDTDKEKLKELLILAATGQIDPNSFATIAKPYVPKSGTDVLPKGTYPGQDLYFIHLEMLGMNTCELIEPKQRRACGKHFGSHVTAEQCEVQPYCCYNPYFGGQVTLDGADSESDVPWCYYNIFFVFHDQYKLRIQEADQFKGPQDCPGLFRYNLDLDPFLYYTAVGQLFDGDTKFGSYNAKRTEGALTGEKLGKLIHFRSDVGFPGITKFHCVSILGACWDDNAHKYSGQYDIPQCYQETRISDGENELNLYDPSLFKPNVPTQFRAAEGECDTNYFHISTLYYERRACTYDIDMIKYGNNFSPLAAVTRNECINRLGCCFEEDPNVIRKYPWMPRCYKRVEDSLLKDRLFDAKPLFLNGDQVCGKTAIESFIQTRVDDGVFDAAVQTKILNYNIQYEKITADTLNVPADHSKPWLRKSISDILAADDLGDCLFIKTKKQDLPNGCDSDDGEESNCRWWNVFDLFNKEELKSIFKKYQGIPLELQGMVDNFF